MEINTQLNSVQTEQVSSKKTSLYKAIWRWHFYGGNFISSYWSNLFI